MKRIIFAFFTINLCCASGFATTPEEDWQARKNAPGVILANGFDTESDWSETLRRQMITCGADFKTCKTQAWDPNMAASGAGSFRHDKVGSEGPGASGDNFFIFKDANGNPIRFGEDANYKELWIQWRQRFDTNFLTEKYGTVFGVLDLGGWKQMQILDGLVDPNDPFYLDTCPINEIVIQAKRDNIPGNYHHCGKYMPFGGYSNEKFHSNEWMTFMVHISFGPGQTSADNITNQDAYGYVDSTFEFFVGREGGELKLHNRKTNFMFVQSSSPEKWGYHKMVLTSFMTGKVQNSAPTGRTWFDELIVSTQPIAAPGATSNSDTVAPNTPTGLRAD